MCVRVRRKEEGNEREKKKRGDRRGACARGVATTADAFLEWNRRSQFASRRPPSLPLFTDFLIILEEVTFHGDKSFDPRPRPIPRDLQVRFYRIYRGDFSTASMFQLRFKLFAILARRVAIAQRVDHEKMIKVNVWKLLNVRTSELKLRNWWNWKWMDL